MPLPYRLPRELDRTGSRWSKMAHTAQRERYQHAHRHQADEAAEGGGHKRDQPEGGAGRERIIVACAFGQPVRRKGGVRGGGSVGVQRPESGV